MPHWKSLLIMFVVATAAIWLLLNVPQYAGLLAPKKSA
jgi:hypothetical protein